LSRSVFLLCTSDLYGGVEKNVLLRACELQGRGHRVTVAVSCDELERRAREQGLDDVRRVRRGGDVDVTALVRYVRQLRAVRPDALFIAHKMDFWLGSLAGRIARIPKIVLYLGIERQFRRGPKYRTVFSRLADCMVVNSESLRSRVIESSPFIPPSRIVVIRNGFPVPERREPSDELRRRLGVPEDAILIGAAGRLARQKGFDLAPEFLSRLVDRWPVYLAIAGEGRERRALEQAGRAAGLADRILLLGYVEDMAGFFRGIDLFVLFSRYEGMANVLNEAMSYGVPVISTRVSGSEELLLDGALGPLVDVDDVGSLAEAAERLFQAGLTRSERLVEHIRVNYSIERMIDQTEAVLFSGDSGPKILKAGPGAT
jgi:glycosyltransferase involved in cell wall biosynthesis